MQRYRKLVAAIAIAAIAAILVIRFVLPADQLGQVEVVDTNAIHRLQEQKPLEPRLLVNLNTADFEELQKINGVGPVLAQAILDHRAQHGAFASVEDLDQVKGIGEKSLERMRPHCFAGSSGEAPSSEEELPGDLAA